MPISLTKCTRYFFHRLSEGFCNKSVRVFGSGTGATLATFTCMSTTRLNHCLSDGRTDGWTAKVVQSTQFHAWVCRKWAEVWAGGSTLSLSLLLSLWVYIYNIGELPMGANWPGGWGNYQGGLATQLRDGREESWGEGVETHPRGLFTASICG